LKLITGLLSFGYTRQAQRAARETWEADTLRQCQRRLIDTRDKVAVVTLNRPDKRNALSIALRNEVDRCLQELDSDDSVSVVIITGAGSAFCAGFDTTEFVPDAMQAVEESSSRYHWRLFRFPKPLVAAVCLL